MPLRYLHTMVRVANVDKSLDFYCNKLGMQEIRRIDSEAGRFTNIFLTAPEDKGRATAEKAPLLELTFNWDPEVYGEGRNFGHLAFEVDDIYATCDQPHEGRHHHQPPAARRAHGLHPLARQHLDRAAAEGRIEAQAGALGIDAQHRQVVSVEPTGGVARTARPIVGPCRPTRG